MDGRKKEISNISFEIFNFEELSSIPGFFEITVFLSLSHLDNDWCDE